MSANRVTAAGGSRKKGGGKTRKRVEKLVYVETKTVTVDGTEVETRLLSQGGRIGLGEVTETGDPVFVPLNRVRTHRNADKRGTYRSTTTGCLSGSAVEWSPSGFTPTLRM